MSTFASTTPRSLATGGARRAPARWAVVAAHLVPLVTLPSGLWRLALVFGASMGILVDGEPFDPSGWEIPYIVGLSVVAEATALLTIGLVRPWGERAPRWMPFIGGKTVPAKPVVAVAATGALALAYIWTFAAISYAPEGFDGARFTDTAWEVVFIAAYAPLLLWAPLVGAVTFDYWRRRR